MQVPVFEVLRHLHLRAPFSHGWDPRGRHFSGSESAWLWLRNSRAALASWGAVFTWLGSQRTAFFRFREHLVVVAELRGGTCILGRRFYMVGIPEGGIFQVQRAPGCDCGTQGRHLHLGAPFFKSRERLDAAAGLSVRHFFSQINRESSRCRAQGAAFFLKGVFLVFRTT